VTHLTSFVKQDATDIRIFCGKRTREQCIMLPFLRLLETAQADIFSYRFDSNVSAAVTHGYIYLLQKLQVMPLFARSDQDWIVL
jgi:hypothetical protein